MNRSPLTQKELQKIAQDLVENPELDEETYFPSSDSEFSEEEIEQQDEESASEEENTWDESEGDEETMEQFFIGKKWIYTMAKDNIPCFWENQKDKRSHSTHWLD